MSRALGTADAALATISYLSSVSQSGPPEIRLGCTSYAARMQPLRLTLVKLIPPGSMLDEERKGPGVGRWSLTDATSNAGRSAAVVRGWAGSTAGQMRQSAMPFI